jgi:hypothetical protein
MPPLVRPPVRRRFAAAALLVALAGPAAGADSPATPAPAPAIELRLPAAPVAAVTTPVTLFNGRSLEGWTYLAAGQPADIATVCSVKDGVIAVTGVPGRSSGFLLLPEVRADYRLHVEWRWTAAVTANTNGGILLNVVPGPLQQGLWPVCFQLQLKATRAGDFIAMSTAASAEAAPGATASRRADASEKPAGEWNTADITVRGDTIACTINGVPQNTLTRCVPAAGRIGFQLEGHPFELRAVRLTPLTP